MISWADRVKSGGMNSFGAAAALLADIYKMMKDYEDDKGESGFEKIFKEQNADVAIIKYINVTT